MSKDNTAKQKAAQKRKKRELELRKKKAEQNRVQAKPSVEPPRTLSVQELPIADCVISEGWQERGLAHILLARTLPDGNLMVGGYYVDTFCLGIKDSAILEKLPPQEYEETIKPTIFNDPVNLIPCDPSLARAVVEGAADYALELGFKPNKRWPEAKKLFAGIDPLPTPLVFGKEGKPCYVRRDESNAQAIIAKLNRNPGQGNYLLESEAKG